MALPGFGLAAGRQTATTDAAPWSREYVQLVFSRKSERHTDGSEQQTRAAGVLWTALVATSHLVLGVHWPSDVLAAMCLDANIPLLIS